MDIFIKQVIQQITLSKPLLLGVTRGKKIQKHLFNLPFKDTVKQNLKSRPFIALLLAIFLIPGFMSGCGATERTDAEYVEHAKDYQDKGQLNESIVELKNALLQNPDNSEARMLLGTIYVELGNGVSAAKELLRAQALGVSREGIAIPLAKAFILQGKHSQVIAKIIPDGNLTTYDKAQVYALRGNAFIGENKLDEAAEAYHRALELEPELTSAQLGQARLAAIHGNEEEAHNSIEKALAGNPESAEAFSLLGDLELGEGNAAAAETAFSKAIKLRPYLYGKNNIDMVKRAQARVQLGKYAEADTDIQALKKAGLNDYPFVNYVAGLSYFYQKKYAEAAIAFDASHNMNPSYRPAEYYLAVTHYLLGNFEQASNIVDAYIKQITTIIGSKSFDGCYSDQPKGI